MARPIAGSARIRLTVVAHDRPGFLADSAAALADHSISVVEASAVTWSARELALHALTVVGAESLDEQTWSRLGDDLRSMGTFSGRHRPRFAPAGQATVTASGTGPGQTLVRVGDLAGHRSGPSHRLTPTWGWHQPQFRVGRLVRNLHQTK